MDPSQTGESLGLIWQPSLFDVGEPEDMSFDRLVRHQLDARSWVDFAPGWLREHDRLFEELLESANWRQRQRRMYEGMVDEPRLTVSWYGEEIADLPARIEQIRTTLSTHYGVGFDSVHINLYRNGADSVAWHGDTVRKTMTDPVVVTVSLGAHRRFLLRKASGGPALHRFEPGEGDLLVMGGACQHDWQHTVPKTKHADGARMSITMRHSRPPGEGVGDE